MAESAGILFKIKGDASDGVNAIKQTESSMAKLTGAFAAGTVAGNLITSGVEKLTSAVVDALPALFNLTKNAAEFGSKIYDASQKTGLGAERLSALKAAADQSGSSLEEVTGGLARFAKTIGEAADGSDKAQAKLAGLGITSTDLDTALQQALKTIVALPPGVEQMTAAQQAFGKSGADLLPMIRSFDGDLVGLTRRMKDLGVTIDDDAARAADAFGDQMDVLNAQLAGVGRTIGTELMPVFTDMASDVSAWLAANKNEVKAWGTTSADFIRGVAAYWRDATKAAEGYFNIKVDGESKSLLGIIVGGAVGQAIVNRGKDERESQYGPFASDMTPDKPVDDSAGFAASDAAKKAREEAFKKDMAERKQWSQLILEQNRELFQKTQEEWEAAYKSGAETEQKFIDSTVSNIVTYEANVKNALKGVFDANQAVAKSAQEQKNNEIEYANAVISLSRDIIREKKSAQDIVKSQRKEQADAEKKNADEKKKQDDENFANYEEGLRLIMQLEQQRFDEEWKHAEEIAKKRKEDNAFIAATMIKPSATPQDGQSPPLVGRDAFDQFGQAIEDNLSGDKMTAAIAGLQVMQEAFSQLGQAVGEAVRAFVLFGNAGGGIRKFTAVLLANIAQMAAVQAVWELAQGFAMLAMNFFWPDPKTYASAIAHFHAAAIYGGIAGIAAGAGRAVAGDSFKQEAGGASGGGGGGSNNGPERKDRNVEGQGKMYSGQGENTLTGSINKPQTIHLVLDSNGVLDVLENSVRNNGRGRDLILNVSGS